MKLDIREREGAKELLQKSIAINTENPSENEIEYARMIGAYFKDTDCKIVYQNIGQNRENVIVTLFGKNQSKKLVLNGHLDTVPSGNLEKWIQSPHKMLEKDGLWIGRGVSDMKSGVCSMLYAMKKIASEGIVPALNIEFWGTADEETDGLGASELSKTDVFKNVTAMIISEPTENQLGIASLGCIWLEVKVTGKAAHGAYPDQGINALDYVYKIKSLIDKKISGVENKLLGLSTCQLTSLNGGTKANMVPEFAKATFDIRTIPEIDQEGLLIDLNGELERMSQEKEGLKLKVGVLNKRNPVSIDKEQTIVKQIQSSYHKVVGLEQGFSGIRFFSDASIFQLTKDIPTILFGPGKSSQAHQTNEYLDPELYYQSILTFYDLIKTIEDDKEKVTI